MGMGHGGGPFVGAIDILCLPGGLLWRQWCLPSSGAGTSGLQWQGGLRHPNIVP